MNPADLDDRVRTLSDSERLTGLLSLAATTDDPELRMAAVGAARQALDRIERHVHQLRDLVVAHEAEAARRTKGATK